MLSVPGGAREEAAKRRANVRVALCPKPGAQKKKSHISGNTEKCYLYIVFVVCAMNFTCSDKKAIRMQYLAGIETGDFLLCNFTAGCRKSPSVFKVHVSKMRWKRRANSNRDENVFFLK